MGGCGWNITCVNSLVILLPIVIVFYSMAPASGYMYQTDFFQVPLDHFSFAGNSSLKIRYLYNDTFWKREDHGPILFYTGNEGSIESFANNTGFMWEIAEEFGAMVVFAEHRFYGQSYPDDFSFDSPDVISVLGYLTVEQVLADFAKLIVGLKKSFDAERSPVIAFGGSYGGQLTTYLRMKYPHIVIGGIAASAPLFFTESNCELHDKVLMSVFTSTSEHCTKTIRKSWDAINSVTKTDTGKLWLEKLWNLCDPLESADNVTTLKSWLGTMYYDMGMVNYPYPANFLRDLPANPVKTFCSKIEGHRHSMALNHIAREESLLMRLYEGINMYYNYSGTETCFDYSDVDDTGDGFSTMDAQSFDFQSCTELIAPMCDDGIQDFFEAEPWNATSYAEDCEEQFGEGIAPMPERFDLFYGGRDILAASNIVFSNGLLDPWHSYGVLKNVSDSLLAIVYDGAHHLDLRAADPSDPPSVRWAREFEKNVLREWIREYQENELKINEIFSS